MKSITKNSVTFGNFPYFDGIRAISIIWVIIHHIPVGFPDWIESIRIRGDLGVELFFAISGFLVCRSLHQSFLKSKSPQIDFLKKRLFRILPPYLLTLILIFFISFIDKGLQTKLNSIQNIWFSFPTFTYNYFKSFTSGNIPGSLNIFWSLCFEEQFYISLFILSFFSDKSFSKILFSLLYSSVITRNYLLLTGTLTDHQILQMQPHLRLDAILVASLCYIHFDEFKNYFPNRFLIICTAIIATCLHTILPIKYYGLNYLVISISFTSFVISQITNESIPRKILSSSILKKIGAISYEIYLTHELVIAIGVRFGLKNSPLLYLIYSLVFSYIAAYLFFNFFSNPINLMLRKRFLNE